MRKLKVCDQWCMDKTTTMYEYFLDYWGMYIGTFRFIPCFVIMICCTIETLHRIDLIAVLVNCWIIYYPVNKHLFKHNRLHAANKLQLLNLEALSFRNIFVRIAILSIVLIGILFQQTFHEFVLGFSIGCILMFWSYCMCVFVRERRNKKHEMFKSKLAMQGT